MLLPPVVNDADGVFMLYYLLLILYTLVAVASRRDYTAVGSHKIGRGRTTFLPFFATTTTLVTYVLLLH